MSNNLAKIFSIVVSFVLVIFLILLGELYCRVFCDIPFLGNSRALFVKNAYGDSIGNAAKIEAVSFGTKVYTDINGFRVPIDFEGIRKPGRAILFLGDSVAFGPGTREEDTFVGLARKEFLTMNIYNSAVIGYDTRDYKNVMEHFIPQHEEVERIYLIFCLNDICHRSAELIDNAIGALKQESGQANKMICSLGANRFIQKINQYLRSRSKLYLALRHILTDPSALSWEADRLLYESDNEENFMKTMRAIIYINDAAKIKKIPFTVIIAPYEFQLRDNFKGNHLPQEKLVSFFKKEGINYINALDYFKGRGIKSKEIFLTSDPMHFSPKGHKIMHEIICEDYSGQN
ncbi:MAG: hypothetical protein KJ864_06020 [Candidatus Omnitrophica bacterium]|nr:hypothetical protein [Candidatus Omnitrophota bacterium]